MSEHSQRNASLVPWTEFAVLARILALKPSLAEGLTESPRGFRYGHFFSHPSPTAFLRLAFAEAPALPALTFATFRKSLAHSSTGTRLKSALTNFLPLLVGFRFRALFTPLEGFFSPFPHGTFRYRSLGSI